MMTNLSVRAMLRRFTLALAVLGLTAPVSAQQRRTAETRPTGEHAPTRITFDRPDITLDEALALMGAPRSLHADAVALDPGVALELDGAHDMTYTPDATRIVVVGLLGNSLAVHDAATGAFLWGLEGIEGPLAVAATDEVAVVAAAFSNEAVIVDLTTRAVRARVALSSQPAAVQMSPDGAVAYVGSIGSQQCARIDVGTGAVLATFPLPVALTGGSYVVDAARQVFNITPFRITPAGDRIVAGSFTGVHILDATTGAVLSSVTTPDPVNFLDLTPDGTTALGGGGINTAFLTFIDIATGTAQPATLLDNSVYPLSTAVRADGQRAIAAVVGLGTVFVDRIGGTTPVGRGFRTVAALSGNRAIAVGNSTQVLDFGTGAVLSTGNRVQQAFRFAVRGDNIALSERFETLARIDVATATVQRTHFGEGVEGDAPRTVAVSADGKRALVTLAYSDNLAFVDLVTRSVVARFPAGTTQPAAAVFTRDGLRLLVTGVTASDPDAGDVVLLDAATGAVLDRETLPASLLRSVFVTPDGARVIVHEAALGTAYVYALTPGGLTLERSIPIGGTVLSFRAFATPPFIGLSPTGRHLVGLNSFEGEIFVGDVTTGVTTVFTTDNFYSDVGFSADGTRALVTAQGGTALLLALGDTPTLLNVRTYPDDAGPVAFDAQRNRFIVGDPFTSPASLFEVSPATGEVLTQLQITAPFFIQEVLWTPEAGTVLVGKGVDGAPGVVYANGQSITLTANAAEAELSGSTLVVAIPGPDRIEVVDLMPVAGEAPPAVTAALAVGPNPARGHVSVRLSSASSAAARVTVSDALGRQVAVLHDGPLAAGPSTFTWDASAAAPGVYVVRLDGADAATRRVTVVR